MKYFLLALISFTTFAATPEMVCTGTEGPSKATVTTTINLHAMAISNSYYVEVIERAPHIRAIPTFGSMSSVPTKDASFGAKGTLVDGKVISLTIPINQPMNMVKGRFYGTFVNDQAKLAVLCDKKVATVATKSLPEVTVQKIDLTGWENVMPGGPRPASMVDAKFEISASPLMPMDEKEWKSEVRIEDGVNYVTFLYTPSKNPKPHGGSIKLNAKVQFRLPIVVLNPQVYMSHVKQAH